MENINIYLLHNKSVVEQKIKWNDECGKVIIK
jgi:hypothetical protein